MSSSDGWFQSELIVVSVGVRLIFFYSSNFYESICYKFRYLDSVDAFVILGVLLYTFALENQLCV